MLLDAIKAGKKVFFLLDEIFRGTNLQDRQIGAFNILEFLNKSNCAGMVSTHDLDITTFANKAQNIHNHFFKEHYQDGKIKFDYKLHDGVSNSSDAIYLMKMVGLDIKES